MLIQHEWTKEESNRYLADGTPPNLDLTREEKVWWIFDASKTPGHLPEVQFDIIPNFEKHPATCAFDVDGKGLIALIKTGIVKLRR